MMQQRPILCLLGLFVLISLACNAFGGTVEPELELPPPTFVATLSPGGDPTVEGAAPTVTIPGGTEAAQATAVPPLQGPYITVLVDLNVRTGPGVQYDRVGFLLQGESAPILGVDPASGWWKIQCPATLTGSDCWVSGGAQYSQAANADGVPAAPVPPSPTPPPTPTAPPVADTSTSTSASTAAGLVAYADNTGLWVIPVNVNASPPTAGAPRQLATQTDISRLLISPDGKKVAFLGGSSEANILGYFNTDGDGGDILVASVSLPNATGSTDVAVLIDQMQWLPDSQALAFSTYVVNKVGPGAAPQADLWTVSLNGARQERFPAGSGGDTFNISPDGARVIFGLPESVMQVNMDGTNRQTVLNFARVNTASEYAYAPVVQWLANGNTAVAAVSSQDPWQLTASASLYRIQNGNAFVSGNVAGNILFSPVQWTSDGSRLGYLRFIPDGSNINTVVIADSNGAAPQAYRSGQNMRVFGWSPDNAHLLYAGETDDTFIGVGRPGAAPVEVLVPVGLMDAQWLNNTAFIMALGTSNIWNITSGNLAGNTQILATATGDNIPFDTWTP